MLTGRCKNAVPNDVKKCLTFAKRVIALFKGILKMTIVHIAKIENNPCNGVSVVVPQHICAQSNYANVLFYNLNNIPIVDVENLQVYSKSFTLDLFESNPDLVVFHEAYCKEYPFIARLLHRKSIPYVIIPHSQLTKGAQNRKHLKKILANYMFFNRFFNNAAAVQFLSNAEYEESVEIKPKKFIATNGIELPTVQKTKFNKQNISFLYIGRLEAYQKGLDLMIEAFYKERDLVREKGARLDIYGPDANGRYAFLDNMIKDKQIEDIIGLHQAVTGTEKQNTLLTSDVFVQTSRFEGMPMGVLEAMSYGLPVLITDGTTLGGTVTDTNSGWSCPTDAASISQMLRKILKDECKEAIFKEKSKNAIKLIKSEFVWEKVAKNEIDSYQNIILRNYK